ncbi:MAG: MBL fold metallo-hydrolase [Clostridia bacterium]|nr:MBL fold metallo-hydrolase [Clostridia bacterium]
MSANRRTKKLIISLAVIVLALVLLIFGERISEAIESVTGIPSLSKFPKIFSSKPKDGEVQIHVIDVDQADSILIRSRDGNILIDTGTNDSEAALKAHLDACKIKKIDYLICTHPHTITSAARTWL